MNAGERQDHWYSVLVLYNEKKNKKHKNAMATYVSILSGREKRLLTSLLSHRDENIPLTYKYEITIETKKKKKKKKKKTIYRCCDTTVVYSLFMSHTFSPNQ